MQFIRFFSRSQLNIKIKFFYLKTLKKNLKLYEQINFCCDFMGASRGANSIIMNRKKCRLEKLFSLHSLSAFLLSRA